MGTKTLVVVLVVVAMAAAAADAAVTVYNPVRLVVDILVNNDTVQVTTEIVTINITDAQQYIKVKVPDGQFVEANVLDGDVLLVIPDPNDPLHAVLVMRMLVGGAQLLTPIAAPFAAPQLENLLPPATP